MWSTSSSRQHSIYVSCCGEATSSETLMASQNSISQEESKWRMGAKCYDKVREWIAHIFEICGSVKTCTVCKAIARIAISIDSNLERIAANMVFTMLQKCMSWTSVTSNFRKLWVLMLFLGKVSRSSSTDCGHCQLMMGLCLVSSGAVGLHMFQEVTY